MTRFLKPPPYDIFPEINVPDVIPDNSAITKKSRTKAKRREQTTFGIELIYRMKTSSSVYVRLESNTITIETAHDVVCNGKDKPKGIYTNLSALRTFERWCSKNNYNPWNADFTMAPRRTTIRVMTPSP